MTSQRCLMPEFVGLARLALTGLPTPEFVVGANGKLWLVYEPTRRIYHLIVKIKFVIYNYYCSTFGLGRTQQLSNSPNLLVFASVYIYTAKQFLFLKY